MKQLYIILIIITFSSCKKGGGPNPVEIPDPSVPVADISYKSDGRFVVQADVNPLIVDVNTDGTLDVLFYVVPVGNSEGERLFIGSNCLNGSATVTAQPDDNALNNAAPVIPVAAGTEISEVLQTGQWNSDDGSLAIRYTSSANVVTYGGDWSDESQKMMSLRMVVAGKVYFGWIRVKYSRNESKLTVVDYAYNKISGMPCLAGAK